MSPPALIAFDDDLTQKSDDDEWQGFRVFPGENPNPHPNFDLFVKNSILKSEKTVGPIFSHSLSESSSSVREDSFRMMLPPAMPPPRDSAVPLPSIPEPIVARKKISRQESILSLRKTRYSGKALFAEKPHRRFDDEDFRCNAFCLTLPGFGKPKPPATKREDSMDKKMIKTPSFSNITISNRASLEKFECGSWASTTVLITAHEDRRFFDLPVEMIKGDDSGAGSDVQTPVSSGFLFDRETSFPKSVLKTSSPGHLRRPSPETSPRRVRFTASASCPTSPRSCITPRLRKARDDFNAFLAAQNA